MKCQNIYYIYLLNYVALFTRAWIEIFGDIQKGINTIVALFTRAWIEIFIYCLTIPVDVSRPLHEGVD